MGPLSCCEDGHWACGVGGVIAAALFGALCCGELGGWGRGKDA